MNRSFLTVSGYIFLSRITGFIRDILAASHLGASCGMDIFLIAFKLPNFFRRLFAEGAFSVAFVPQYTAILMNKGPKQALRFAHNTGWILACILVIFVSFMEWHMETMIALTAPGLDPEYMPLTVQIARIIFPFIGWIALATFFSGILNAHENFGPAAAMGMSLNLLMIGVLLGNDQRLEYLLKQLGWAVHISGIIQCSILGFLCYKRGLKLTWAPPVFDEKFRQLCRKIGPAFLGGGVLQINAFVGLMLASLLPVGSISYLFYADRLVQLPLSIVGIALSTTLLPVLTKQLEGSNATQALETQEKAIKIGLGLSVSAMLGLFIFAPSIVAVLFGRGAFNMQSVLATAEVLKILVLGLPVYILVKIGSTIFFAHQDTRRPFIAGALAVVFDIVFSILLLKQYTFKGIAVATTGSYFIQASLLFYWLIKEKHIVFSALFYRWLQKLSMACVSSAGIFYGIQYYLKTYCLTTLSPQSSFNILWEWKRFSILGFGLSVAAFFLVIIFLSFKVINYNDFRQFIQKKVRKSS